LTIGLICLFLSHGLANSTVIVVAGNHTAGFYGDVLGLPTRMHSGILVFSHKEVDSQRSEVPEMLISQVELPRSWWGTRVGLAGPRSRARGDRRKSGSVGPQRAIRSGHLDAGVGHRTAAGIRRATI